MDRRELRQYADSAVFGEYGGTFGSRVIGQRETRTRVDMG